MAKPKKPTSQDPESVVNSFIALCVISLVLFSLRSGGELLGLLMALIVLAVAYKIVRHSFREIYLEKLFFITIGLYFTGISLFGFTLTFFGLNLSVKNFFILAFLALIAILYLTSKKKPCKIKIEWNRVLLTAGSFLIAFLVYMWPALPSFTSPCTCGFDCTLHIDYAGTIYHMETVAPPVREWRFYPAGFHINVAMLTHALESDMPANSNLIYPLIAFASALMIGMLCGMLYDRVKNKLYVLLFLIAILAAVYPSSALIAFGFWANLFGMYYIILFAWALSDFVEDPENKSITLVLLLIAFGSVIAYQILTSLTLIISFILASLSLINVKLDEKIKITLIFLAVFGLLYGFYLLEEYSKFLGYSINPAQTREYFSAHKPEKLELIDRGRLDIKLNGTMFQVRGTGVHVEDILAVPGVQPLKMLSKGNVENLKEFIDIGAENIRGPSGAALYFDIKWFGLLTLFLMALGLIYAYNNREYTLVFMEASIIHLSLFYYGTRIGAVNWYYYSKMMYFFIYPVTLYAIVGVEELLSNMSTIKKRFMVVAVIMLLMVSYSMSLINKDSVGILIGERKDLYENGAYWPLLEFNRFQRYWDMVWGIKRDSYGFGKWLQMSNITLPFFSTPPEKLIETTSGVWKASSDFQHETGGEGSDGSWESKPGGFGYLIGRNYMEIPSGSYNVSFRMKVDDNSRGDEIVCYIEVAKETGNTITGKYIYSKDFVESNVYRDFNLDLLVSGTLHNAEFRVHYNKGQIKVNIEKVTLTQNQNG